MRTITLVLCLFLISAGSAYSQTSTQKEPPVFDKKFWTVQGALIGSSILVTECAVYGDKGNLTERRLGIYTAAGISNLLVFILSANQKSVDKKWWWVAPITISAINSGFAIQYSKSF